MSMGHLKPKVLYCLTHLKFTMYFGVLCFKISRLVIHVSSQEVHFNKVTELVGDTKKGSGLTRQAGQVNKYPTIAANIFVAATNTTNIYIKTDDTQY